MSIQSSAFKNCTICLENIEPKLEDSLDCNHVFHKDCIARWFQEKLKCPLCRDKVEAYIIPKAPKDIRPLEEEILHRLREAPRPLASDEEPLNPGRDNELDRFLRTSAEIAAIMEPIFSYPQSPASRGNLYSPFTIVAEYGSF